MTLIPEIKPNQSIELLKELHILTRDGKLGEIRQVRKAAQTVASVVTYVAVLGFSNTGGRLLPGMTANVRIVTDTRDNVLKVPNAALRVRIAGVEPAAAGAPAGASPGAASSRRCRWRSWPWWSAWRPTSLASSRAPMRSAGKVASCRRRTSSTRSTSTLGSPAS